MIRGHSRKLMRDNHSVVNITDGELNPLPVYQTVVLWYASSGAIITVKTVSFTRVGYWLITKSNKSCLVKFLLVRLVSLS